MTPNSARAIGKIVKSNTHIDYVCQVYCRGEVEQLPSSMDYALGSFVTIELEPADAIAPDQPDVMARLVGVIYNTILLNPDYGSLGPRLSQSSELEIFSPDYLTETAILVGIIALGWQTRDGGFRQGVPALAATINTAVSRLGENEMGAFHLNGGTQNGGAPNQLCMHYVPVLLSTKSPIVPPLLLGIVDRLALHFPEQRRPLAVMRDNLAWKSIVEPAG